MPSIDSFPKELEERLCRAVFGSVIPSKQDLKRVSTSLNSLWPVLAKERGQAAPSTHYSFKSGTVDAYTSYYLFANALKPFFVWSELEAFGLSMPPSLRVLDLGCGPGTAFAGLRYWAEQTGRSLVYQGVDQSKEFLKRGQSVASALHASASFSLSKNLEKDFAQNLRGFAPDFVLWMNSFSEWISDPKKRHEVFLEQLNAFQKTASEKLTFFVLIEPGSKFSSRELLELREHLRKMKDVRIWLPCLDARPCGALSDPQDWCHEAVEMQFPQWFDNLSAEAGMRKESLLFSYLVFSVGPLNGMWKEREWPLNGQRMVSQRMQQKGLTQCYLCTANGKVKARVLDSKQTESNAFFLKAVRGQVFKDLKLSEKGDIE